MLDTIRSEAVSAFHDQTLSTPGWPANEVTGLPNEVWRSIEANHRLNALLWAEEDRARRVDVPDSKIAENKRNIDRYNQRRNDAIERMDELILEQLPLVRPGVDVRLNSETAGSIIDRLSILCLKIFHLGIETKRSDVIQAHRDECLLKRKQLKIQRADLQHCLDELLEACAAGRAYFKVYRQFKMYNDPRLNPYLSRGKVSVKD